MAVLVNARYLLRLDALSKGIVYAVIEALMWFVFIMAYLKIDGSPNFSYNLVSFVCLISRIV